MPYLDENNSLKRYKEKMGDDFGELFNAIINVTRNLQIKYREYTYLFGSEKIVNALNEFAPGFFCYIQEILFNDLILHISKIFDDPGKGDRKILCFNCLLEKVTNEDLKQNLTNILNQCNKKRDFASIRRNKYIAHDDYQLFIGKKEYDITIKIEDIKEMTEYAWLIIDSIEYFYFNTYTVKHVYSPNLEFERLLNNIKYFNKAGLKKIIEIVNSID